VSTATVSESGFRVKHSFYTDEERMEFPDRWHYNRKDEDFMLNSLPATRFLVAQIITSGKPSAIGTGYSQLRNYQATITGTWPGYGTYS
jgi:hypothetical protein